MHTRRWMLRRVAHCSSGCCTKGGRPTGLPPAHFDQKKKRGPGKGSRFQFMSTITQ
jgi:hypothetical protein